jgi:competence protein ComEA
VVAPSEAAPTLPTQIVNINTASAADLDALPGIGPKLAEAIVAHRQQYGPFRRPEDLLQVKGIGEKRLQKIRPYISCS